MMVVITYESKLGEREWPSKLTPLTSLSIKSY